MEMRNEFEIKDQTVVDLKPIGNSNTRFTEMQSNHQFDGGVGVGEHGAGMLSDDAFDA
ncbi:hypothetical protein QJS10_CPA05g01721 [Acorus calamus]|uniref:Uncharacterized protein n=1 Tax=Acorus calamus TaxID=4465 RepID=A0AAV9ESC0_ACOCL|nr:hypothetical protein QJS10_CPA05g01721 [Acorus calamus]